jgi:hypothetical protein
MCDCCQQRLPMPRVRRPLTPPDQGHIAQGESRRSLQPAERDVLDQREDVALERREVDELAVLLVPLSGLALAGDVGLGSARSRALAMCGVASSCLLSLDRG